MNSLKATKPHNSFDFDSRIEVAQVFFDLLFFK